METVNKHKDAVLENEANGGGVDSVLCSSEHPPEIAIEKMNDLNLHPGCLGLSCLLHG